MMPRFYFDVIDDVITTDEDGQELPSSAAAIDVAYRSARGLAATAVLEGHLNLKDRIVVRDERGTVTEVSFRQAISVEG
jgi:hypothetical protein